MNMRATMGVRPLRDTDMKLGRRSFLGFLGAAPFIGKAVLEASPPRRDMSALAGEDVTAAALEEYAETTRYMHVAYAQGFIVAGEPVRSVGNGFVQAIRAA